MLPAVVVILILFSAIQAIRSNGLLYAAIWLAVCSALVAILMFWFGAHEAAVIELSVGAGLVTVLFVFSIVISGAGAQPAHVAYPMVPRTLAVTLIGSLLVLLAAMLLISAPPTAAAPRFDATAFASVFWQQRAPDTLVQVVVILAGTFSILGLLAADRHAAAMPDTAPAMRDNPPPIAALPRSYPGPKPSFVYDAEPETLGAAASDPNTSEPSEEGVHV